MAVTDTSSWTSWHDLHLNIDEYFTHYDGYIFRGQADAEWHLESNLTCSIRKIHPNAGPEEIEQIVNGHQSSFKQNIRGRCALDLENASSDSIWSLGQHFGLSTPLLDWTRSPYVALFFSLFGPCISGKRALWAIFESDVDQTQNNKLKKIRIIRPLGHENQRLVNQNGLFMDLPVGKSADEIVAKMKNEEWVTMYKFEFPDRLRDDILAALNNMNINHASLFPDLIGASLFANYTLEARPYLDTARTTGFIGN